jgi:tetratricopeptide (TPR) repeat protein
MSGAPKGIAGYQPHHAGHRLKRCTIAIDGETMISWVAMDRIVEKERAANPAYRQASTGKVLRSDARFLSDGELLAKLRSFAIQLDRPSLQRLCAGALSAEEIAEPLLDQRTFHGRQDQMESDWIWICLAALWQRWFPEEPSFESLDDKIQAGYELRAPGNAPAVCRIWLDAWKDTLGLFDKGGMHSIHEFDDRFGGTQCLHNWVQDLQDELWTAAVIDRQFLTARVAFCEEGLRRFPASDDLMTENRRRALAETYFELGDPAKTDSFYRDWLRADPRWGWGWIGWSDCYRFTHTEFKDLARFEQILREGLSIAGVRDRQYMLERLADACEEQGRKDEAAALWREAKLRATAASAAPPRPRPAPIPITSHKTGRNDPCPCGSGKKFKKCCGA